MKYEVILWWISLLPGHELLQQLDVDSVGRVFGGVRQVVDIRFGNAKLEEAVPHLGAILVGEAVVRESLPRGVADRIRQPDFVRA